MSAKAAGGADAVQEQSASEVHVREASQDRETVGQENQINQEAPQQEAQTPLVEEASARWHEAYERHAAANNWETVPISRAWKFDQIPQNHQAAIRGAMAELLDWLGRDD